jgi:hypothetical protein
MINPRWAKTKCPGCKKTIYIDDENKRTYHQAPLCDWYNKFCSTAKCEGKIILENLPREIAPPCCIVCAKIAPEEDSGKTWSYLAGATPIGAIVCSRHCLNIAVQRHEKSGRVDKPKREPS